MWTRRNFAPVLFLSIDDESADDLLRRVTSFTYKKSLDKAAETKFTFRNDDLSLMQDKRFYMNVRWRFRYGYFNDLSPIITGIVRQLEPDYEERRMVTVTLYDDASSMGKKSSGRNWGRVPSSQIAEQIAKRYGLGCQADPSNDQPKKAWVQPATVNDLQFLRDMAADIDFEVFVDGVPPVLYYRPMRYNIAPHPKRLVYYSDPSEFSYVKKFSPKMKGLGPLKTGASKTDGNKGKPDSKFTKDGDDASLGDAKNNFETVWKPGDNGNAPTVNLVTKEPPSRGGGSGEGVTNAAPSGANTRQLSGAARAQQLDKANEASSEHPLTPSIIPGRLYEWDGLDPIMNRKWYCQAVTHTITGNSATTSVEWKRNATNKGNEKSKNPNSKGAGDGTSDGDQSGVPSVELNAESGKQKLTPGTPNSQTPKAA